MSGPPLKIRHAQAGEAELLTDMALSSKRSNGYDDAFMAACRKELTVTETDIGALPLLVAVDEHDRPLGFALLELKSGAEADEVRGFFVAAEAKRQGIGRALWHALRETALQLGLNRLVLDADPFAVTFYQSMGFRIVGEAPSGSISDRVLPHMAIDLN